MLRTLDDDGRPAVLPREALGDMQELLKFRHLTRHGYEASPDAPRMAEHGRRVERASAAIVTALGALASWLRAG